MMETEMSGVTCRHSRPRNVMRREMYIVSYIWWLVLLYVLHEKL